MANLKVGDLTPRAQYTASSGQTAFTYPFPIFANADLKVYVGNTLKTLTTDYTVTGAGTDNGGTVTLVSGASTGDIVTVFRDMPVARTSDYQVNGDLLATTLNDDLDKLVMMCQQIEEAFDGRTILLDRFAENPTNAEGRLTPLVGTVTDRANKYLAFTSDGNIGYVAGTSSDIVPGTVGTDLVAATTQQDGRDAIDVYSQSEVDAVDSTLEGNINLKANSTDPELNGDVTGSAILDDDTMATASDTTLATSESIKAYVDTGIPRVSARVKMNTSNLVYQTLYSKSVATDFGVSSGTILNVFFELECKTAHDGFTVGNIVSMYGMNNGYSDSHQNPAHWSSSDCATATVYTATNDTGSGVLHLWTKTVGSITADTWLDYDKWDIYARVYYTI